MTVTVVYNKNQKPKTKKILELIIRHNKKIKFDGISIYIIGPTSVSENVITYKEATKIFVKLNKFFDIKKNWFIFDIKYKSNINQIC